MKQDIFANKFILLIELTLKNTEQTSEEKQQKSLLKKSNLAMLSGQSAVLIQRDIEWSSRMYNQSECSICYCDHGHVQFYFIFTANFIVLNNQVITAQKKELFKMYVIIRSVLIITFWTITFVPFI